MAKTGGRSKPANRNRGRCPVCGRPTNPDYRPFCSARCADKDLGRWLKGIYRIPTEEPPDGGEAERDDEA